MKKVMLLASGIFFALAPINTRAQDDGIRNVQLAEPDMSYNDTLVISLKGSDKILFIGDDLREMVKYQKADSLKALFISDREKALADKSLGEDVQIVHYFVHGSGKRRLKAENAEFSDNRIDVAWEMTRLNLDLPRYRYCIYDLSSNYVFQIYVTDPAQLSSTLNAVNLNDAIRFPAAEKKELKRSYKMEMNAAGNDYKVTGKVHGRQDAIELSPGIGLGTIGGYVGALAAFDLTLRLTDKYGTGKYKLGASYTAFPMVNTLGGEIASVNYMFLYDVRFLRNLNVGTREKQHFLGLQGGITQSDARTFNKVPRFGLVYEGASLSYSFDVMFKDKNAFYGFTVKLPF